MVTIDDDGHHDDNARDDKDHDDARKVNHGSDIGCPNVSDLHYLLQPLNYLCIAALITTRFPCFEKRSGHH